MKRLTIILLFIFYVNLSLAQDAQTVQQEKKSNYSREVYFVLKEDKKIKHGPYTSYGTNGKTLEKGQYETGEKTGVWEFYDWKGELEQKYNYSENEVEWSADSDSKLTFQIEVNGVFVEQQPDQFPVFIGGNHRLNRFVFTNLKYPVEARRNNVAGTVVVSAVITTEGKIIDEKVEFGIGAGCDEESLKVVKAIPDEWIPARHMGEPKKVRIFYPVRFKLD